MSHNTDQSASTLTLCACMGPMYGEPHCLCEMQRRGLKLNEAARAEEHARAKKQWSKFMESGGFSAGVASNKNSTNKES